MDFLFTGELGENLSLLNSLAILGAALGLGLFISLTYILIHKNKSYSSGFVVSLIMLPAIIAVIILLIGNNVARAFSLAGAFSLIRFRSAPGDSKDIAYVFFTLGVGLACGMGYLGYALLFALVLCAAMAILSLVRFGSRQSTAELKIQIPENMEYQGAFEPILKEYTLSYHPTRVRTTEFGALFELSYRISLKNPERTKEFIDALRCKNGNLSIALHMYEGDEGNML